MSKFRIRVVAKPRSEPDLKALARAVIELARLHNEVEAPPTKQRPKLPKDGKS